jgi:hypothetical protein
VTIEAAEPGRTGWSKLGGLASELFGWAAMWVGRRAEGALLLIGGLALLAAFKPRLAVCNLCGARLKQDRTGQWHAREWA